MDIEKSKRGSVLVDQIKVEELTAGYQKKTIVSKLNFKLESGQIGVIIGPNGAGKSTLIRVLSGILPYQGSVLIQGRQLSEMSDVERTQKLSVVPQIASIGGAFSVFQTVSLGRSPYLGWLGRISSFDKEIIYASMEAVEVDYLAKEKMSNLSGGERQRVFLARSLAQGTPIMLFDEPTNNLDINYQIEIMNMIKGLVRKKNLTALIVMHDINMASLIADYMILMMDGQIKAQGRVDKILNQEVLTKVFGEKFDLISYGDKNAKLIIPRID